MTAKASTVITSEIASNLADNTSNAITAAQLRQVVQDINDSVVNSFSGHTANSILGSISGAITDITLGTNLSITSGVLNAATGGGGGSSLPDYFSATYFGAA